MRTIAAIGIILLGVFVICMLGRVRPINEIQTPIASKIVSTPKPKAVNTVYTTYRIKLTEGGSVTGDYYSAQDVVCTTDGSLHKCTIPGAAFTYQGVGDGWILVKAPSVQCFSNSSCGYQKGIQPEKWSSNVLSVTLGDGHSVAQSDIDTFIQANSK